MDPTLLPLLTLFHALQRSWTVRSIEAAPGDDGLCALVELNLVGGGDAAAVDASDDLALTLGERSRRFGKPPVLLVNIRLPRAFPGVPPEVRVLEPVFVTGTGGVCNGNALLPCLWPEGWPRNGGFALTDVLGWLRDHVLTNGALLECDSNHYYNAQAWAASRAKLLRRSDPHIRHASGFSRRLCVYGSEFATTVLGLSLPDGFDAGNKVILPSVFLAQLAQGELRALLADGPVEAGTDAAGTAAARRRLVERIRRGGAPEDEFVDGSAMVFELISALRFPVFVGVAAFSGPHADALVVPLQVLQSLGVPEGSEITLSRVTLPPAVGLVLQPHTVNFEAVEAFTDRPPREFLEASLTRFGCLAEGDVIMCDGGPTPAAAGGGGGLPPHEFWFTVIATRPAPAVALWAEFTAQLPIEFVPAADTFVQAAPPPPPSMQSPRLSHPESQAAAMPGTTGPPPPGGSLGVRPLTATAFAGVGRTLAASREEDALASELRSPRATGPAPLALPGAASTTLTAPMQSPSRGVLGSAAAGLLAVGPVGAPSGAVAAAALSAERAPPAASASAGGGPEDREERRRRAAEAALRRSQQLPQP